MGCMSFNSLSTRNLLFTCPQQSSLEAVRVTAAVCDPERSQHGVVRS